jgi:hypothetical protein
LFIESINSAFDKLDIECDCLLFESRLDAVCNEIGL